MRLLNKNDQRLIKIICDTLHINLNEISLEKNIADISSWDSLKSLQLMTVIEKAYKIKIPLYKFIQIKNIKDIMVLVNGKNNATK